MDSNHCQIVTKSLSDGTAIDEQAFASLAVLNERLQRLKKLDKRFSGVEFSPGAEQLLKQQSPVAAF